MQRPFVGVTRPERHATLTSGENWSSWCLPMVRIKQGIDFTLWGHTIGQAGYSVSRAPAQELCWCLLTTDSLLLCTLRPLSLSITEHAQQNNTLGGFYQGDGLSPNSYSAGGAALWCVSLLVSKTTMACQPLVLGESSRFRRCTATLSMHLGETRISISYFE